MEQKKLTTEQIASAIRIIKGEARWEFDPTKFLKPSLFDILRAGQWPPDTILDPEPIELPKGWKPSWVPDTLKDWVEGK